MKVPLPPDEKKRLRELEKYQIVDTLPEQAYDDITFLASLLCETPIALMSVVTRNRQWFKSRVGLKVRETPRELAFCAHAILAPGDLTVVQDAWADPRFADNPLVTGEPEIRFYAGAPLETHDGFALGTLCVIDRKPRDLSEIQAKALRALSRQVMAQLDLRLSILRHRDYENQLKEYQLQLEASNARLEHEALTDPLTHLGNRRAFDWTLEEETARSQRRNTPLSLILIDVDSFKAYNDDLGHSRGDQALRLLASVLEGQRRRGDFLSRIGGEEFAVILPATSLEGAAVLAERFRSAVEEAPWEDRKITVSVGIAATNPGVDPGALVNAADLALYRAKVAGRNRIAE